MNINIAIVCEPGVSILILCVHIGMSILMLCVHIGVSILILCAIVCYCGRPRDEIARASGIEVHERGGVIVDDLLRTNDKDIYAIGEVALHG